MTTNILIAPGVTVRALQTDKFKTGCFSVNFLRSHSRSTASLDALLPSVLLRGTERYPDMQKISVRLDELYGSTFGTMVRRKGEAKLVGFYADFLEDDFVPSEESVFEGMLEFLHQVLYFPVTEDGCFCQRYVEGEKRNLINAIEANFNDKRGYATSRMLQSMCAEEEFGVPRLGYKEDVEAITAQTLWAHYLRTLENCRIEIFYAGRLSPQEVARAFAPLFAERKEAVWETTHTRVIAKADSVKELREEADVTQGKLVMGLRTGITAADPDYAALALLNGVYGSGMTSKLFVHVREERSLCYYASSSFERIKGILLIGSGIAPENYEIAKTAILEELEACKRGEISPEELESARTQLLSAMRATMDVPARLDDFYVSQAILPTEDLPEQMERIRNLTVDDLKAAAQKLSLDTIYFLEGASQ